MKHAMLILRHPSILIHALFDKQRQSGGELRLRHLIPFEVQLSLQLTLLNMDTSNTAPMTPMVPKSGPKDVFMHLMVFVALYVSVVSFITLLFQYINYWQPDPLTFYQESVMNSIRWSASVLFVMFPVYLVVSWLINKDSAVDADKKNLKVRKWLTYLTLFASALTVIIDIITLLYNFLGGDLTLSFFLKILVVLLVAAAVFGYYLWDLKRETDR